MFDLKHLKRLSEIKSSAGIQFLTPSVCPGNYCPMRFAAEIAEKVEGMSSLVVGMQECTTYSRFFSPSPKGENGELHWLYTLDFREVVFGCRDGLIDALKKMDAAGAKAILVIATCIPELIGEDIEGIIHEVQPELSARLTYTMLGQFKNTGNLSGPWRTMDALAGLMESQKTNTKRINILMQNSGERRVSTPSLLNELSQHGFSLRLVGPGSSVENIRRAPEAAFNLVLTASTLPLAINMEKLFGITYAGIYSFYNVEDIDRAYNDIAGRLGFRWNGEFDIERQWALRLEHKAAERFRGIQGIFAGRVESPLALAAYLGKLGIKPLLLNLEEFNTEDEGFSRELIKMGYDPWICRMMNQEAELPVLEGLDPDIFIGRMQLKSSQREKSGFRGKGSRMDSGGGWKQDKGSRMHERGGWKKDKEERMREGGNWMKGKGGYGKGGRMRGRDGMSDYSSIPFITPKGRQAGYARTSDLLGSIIEVLERTDMSYNRRVL